MATLNSSSTASTTLSPGHNAPTPPPDTSSPGTPSDPVTKDSPSATPASESMRPSEPGGRPLESGCGLVPPKEIGEPQEEVCGGGFPPKDLGAQEDKEQEEEDTGLSPLHLSDHFLFTATGEACLVAQLPLPGSHQLLLPKGFPQGELGIEEEPDLPLLAHLPPTHLTALHIQHGFDPMQGFSSSDQILSHNTSAPSPAACEGRDGAFWSYQLAPNPPGDPKDGPAGCSKGDHRALFWLCLLCRLGFSRSQAFVGHTQSHGVQLSPAQHQGLQGHPAVLQGGGEGCEALLSFLEPKPPAQPTFDAPLQGSAVAEPPGEVNVAQRQDGAPEADAQTLDHPREEVLALSPHSPAPAPWGPSTPQAKESPTAAMGEAGSDWFPEGQDEEAGLCPPLNQSSPASKEGGTLPAPVGSPEDPGDPPPSYRLTDDYAPAPAAFQGLSLSGHMSLLHSRNSCKTLKCPKCNWHYKYQQTLDVHMREKHPESNSHCSYCSAGGAHPRLARGESYNCGYKPYRCDVCNYSTTTKGNLSIHMQSDKHLANLQGFQAGPGGQGSPPEASLPPAAAATADKEPKAKSSWQCKVCSYETNISRNLRIHMTSEKHMQNVLLLHQGLPLGLPPGLVGPGPPPPAGTTPATPPDLFQYFGPQALGPPQGPLPGPGLRPDKPLEAQLLLNGFHHLGGPARKFPAAPQAPGSLSPDAHLPPSQLLGSLADGLPTSPPPEDASALKVFRCLVCQAFSTDSLELLLYHCSVGRSLPEAEWKEVAGDMHRCKLCCYGTQLKANFQLHLKTDKHAQKYQLAAHLREGGGAMGTPMPVPLGEGSPYGSVPPLHLRCNICDFESNSKEKMQLHARGAAHEENSQVYKFLLEMEGAAAEPGLFRCLLCAWEAPSRLAVLHHLRAPAHRDAQAQRRLQLIQSGPAAAEDGLSGLHSILSFSHGQLPTSGKAPVTPLAEPPTPERDTQNKTEPSAPEDAEEKSRPLGDNAGQTTVYCCPYCSFLSPECEQVRAHALAQHAVQPRYRCPLCQEQLVGRPALHFHLSHLHNVVPECVEKLLLVATTVEMTFSTKVLPVPSVSPLGEGSEPPTPTPEPGPSRDQAIEGPQLIPEASPGALPEPPPPAAEAPDKLVGSPEQPPSPAPSPVPRPDAPAEETASALPAAEEEEGPAGEPRAAEPAPPDTRHPLTYRKTTNFALDKFLDPARPYKCTVCKESFTQKNILLVHYNSVSHLHKMKKAAVDPAGPARGDTAPAAATAAADKPFKCTICRVSYNQSSTLEIHMRSVLHQTRSRGARPDPKVDGLEHGPEDAKEGEMEGEVSLEKKGPDPGGFASSLPFLSPPPPPLDLHRFPAPLFSPPVLPPFPLVPESLLKLQQQQLLLPFYLHDLKVTPKLSLAGPAPLLSLPAATAPQPPPAPKSELAERELERPPMTEEGNEAGPTSPPNPAPNEAARTAAKALLENFGFELVIQYNEGKQAAPPPPIPLPPEAPGSGGDKLACGACGKLFSNMLILKTHEEHVHRRFLPFEALSRYAAQFRKSYDSLYQPPAEPPRPSEGPLDSPSPQRGPPFLVAESEPGSTRLPEERGRAGRWPPEEEDASRGNPAPLQPAGRRFSRTKFTEFQTQALQSFFETSAYPKDGEVERLASLLGLASRVVVVWFQNARQKARKHASEGGSVPQGGGSGVASGCRRCHASFSCVFELVRHLKKCYDDQPPEEEEEEAERGDEEEEVEEEDADEEQGLEPPPGPEGPSPEPLDREEPNQVDAAKPGSKEPEGQAAVSLAPTHACDQCAAAFPSQDLLAAHRRLHFLPVVQPSAAPHLLDLPLLVFGERSPLVAGTPTVPGPPLKRKHEDGSLSPTGSEAGGGGEGEPPRDKRLRTTILPEQLEILYRWYMQDSNPTRKMLDCISEEVGLKKRVVQVWFQNTRARERKGQFRGTPGGVHNPAAKPPGPPAPVPAPFPKFNLLLGKVEEGTGREVPKREAPAFPYPQVNSAAAPMAFLPPAKEPSAPTPEPPTPVPLPPAPAPSEDEGPDEPAKASPESEACSPCAGDLSDSSASSLAEPESPGPAGTSGGVGGGVGAPDGMGQRRYRTQMSSLQLKIMKACYEAYRTPTMQECEVLGEEIGLPKRVIQVWFQNARAKEKKAKMQGAAAGAATGGGNEGPLGAQRADCPYCDVKYDFYVSCRGHLFSRQHLAKLKEAVRAQLKNESKCYDLAPAPEAPQAPKAPPTTTPAPLPLGASPALPRLAPVLLSGPALAQSPLGSLAPFSSGPATSTGLLGLATSVLPATTVVQTGPGCPLPQRPMPDQTNNSTTCPPDPAPGPPTEPSGDMGSAERKPVAAPTNSSDALKNLKALKATVPTLLGGQFLPFPLPPAGGATPPAVFGPQLQGAYFQQLYGMKKGLFPMNPVIPQTLIGLLPNTLLQPLPQSPETTATASPKPPELPTLGEGEAGEADELLAGSTGISTVDVTHRYLCRQCKMAFDGEAQAAAHQRSFCFFGRGSGGPMPAPLRVPVCTYHCLACEVLLSGREALASHLRSSAHRRKAAPVPGGPPITATNATTAASAAVAFAKEEARLPHTDSNPKTTTTSTLLAL